MKMLNIMNCIAYVEPFKLGKSTVDERVVSQKRYFNDFLVAVMQTLVAVA